MVRRFGKMMSFSGRLSQDSSGGSNVVPLSLSLHEDEDRLSLPIHTALLTSGHLMHHVQKQVLVQDLIDCKARLLEQSRMVKELRQAHEAQLVSVSRQLLELECGLRKRERELCATLAQRDRVIREQAHIIRFLTKKTGTKRRDILKLADEAVAKIPQLSELQNERAEPLDDSHNATPHSLTSIVESESENDSAIILDELGSGGVSRSVSDADAADKVTKGNYHLLRHGSFERYKIRCSKMQQGQHEHFAQVAANATLPRSKKRKSAAEVFDVSSSLSKERSSGGGSATTVIVIGASANNNGSSNSNNHRSVTKPRDVKNKSNRTKMILKSLSSSSSGSSSSSKSPSPPIGLPSDKFVRQSGSVYCSMFGADLLTSEEESYSYA